MPVLPAMGSGFPTSPEDRISTGIPDLDTVTGGLKYGSCNVLEIDHGVGKRYYQILTALASNAIKNGRGVFILPSIGYQLSSRDIFVPTNVIVSQPEGDDPAAWGKELLEKWDVLRESTGRPILNIIGLDAIEFAFGYKAVLNLTNLMIRNWKETNDINVLVVKSGQESMNMAIHTADTYFLVNELNGGLCLYGVIPRTEPYNMLIGGSEQDQSDPHGLASSVPFLRFLSSAFQFRLWPGSLLAGNPGSRSFPHHLHEFPLRGKDQSSSGTGTHACRHVQILAAVALHGHSHLQLSTYDAVGADHGAHPAAYAFLYVAVDYSCDRVLKHGTGAADRDTRTHPRSGGRPEVHSDPRPSPHRSGVWVQASRIWRQRGSWRSSAPQRRPSRRICSPGTGPDARRLLSYSSRQSQLFALAVDVIDHELCRLEGIRLHCEACTNHILGAGGEQCCHSRASQDGGHRAQDRVDS